MKSGFFQSSRFKMDLCGVAVLISLSIIAWFFEVSPLMVRHAEALMELSKLGDQREHAQKLEKALLSARENLASLHAGNSKSTVLLKPAGELNQTLARLTDFASRSKLVLDGIESGETIRHPRYSTVAIRVTGRGTYRSCAEAIGELRTEMPDIGVLGFQMISPGPTGATPATFVLDLLWYTQPDVASAKK